MSEKEEVQQLIKHIQKGLKQFTIQELNEVMSLALKQKDTSEKDIAKNTIIVLEVICKEYNITREALIYGKLKRDVIDARNIAYCILHFNLKLSIRYIATRVFFLKWHNSVGVAIKNYNQLNPNLQQDKEFIKRIERIQTEAIKKIQ